MALKDYLEERASLPRLVDKNALFISCLLYTSIGFTKAIVPQHSLRQLNLQEFQDMELIGLNYVRDAVRALEG